MEQINVYPILSVGCLLLFLSVFFVLERYKKSNRPISKKLARLKTKLPRDIVLKGFAAGAFILFVKKALYYVPLAGIIQTKSSVWWVHAYVMIYLLVFLVGCAILLILSKDIKELKDILAFFVTFSSILTVILSAVLLSSLPADFDFGNAPTEIQTMATLFLTLPLVLKMLCSGKYLGLLTSLAAGFLIMGNYKKLNPKTFMKNKKFTTALRLISLVCLTFCVMKFPGDWQERFLDKAKKAKNEPAIEDLLDAANTVPDVKLRINIFERIVMDAEQAGNEKQATDVFNRFILTLIQSGEIDAVKEIILTIVKIGDVETHKRLCQQAIDMIKTMPARARSSIIREITTAMAKNAGKNWAKVIFLQLMEAIKTITSSGWFRYDLLNEILQAALSRNDMKGETELFTAAINVANDISYWRNKSLALKAIAVALAKTGHTHWAKSVAGKITDEEIKNNALEEIREIIEKIGWKT